MRAHSIIRARGASLRLTVLLPFLVACATDRVTGPAETGQSIVLRPSFSVAPATGAYGDVGFHALDTDGVGVATDFMVETKVGDGEPWTCFGDQFGFLWCDAIVHQPLDDNIECAGKTSWPNGLRPFRSMEHPDALDPACNALVVKRGDPSAPLSGLIRVTAASEVQRGPDLLQFRSWGFVDPDKECQEGAGSLVCTVQTPDGKLPAQLIMTAFFGPRQTYAFGGFQPPMVAEPAVNRVAAGRSVPVKFSLGGDQGMTIFTDGSPSSQAVECESTDELSDVTATTTAGQSSLSYDAATDTYTYVWKTDKGWANSCRRLSVALTDGNVHSATFHFTK